MNEQNLKHDKKFDEITEFKIIEEYQKGLSSIKIGKQYGSNPTTIINVLRRHNIEPRSNRINSRKYICNENFFENIDTEEKAYWLGFLYADGYFVIQNSTTIVGISLAEKDKEHLNKFNNSLSSNHPVNSYISKSGYSMGKTYCRIHISSQKMVLDLLKRGMVPNKTMIVKPPILRSDLVKHFVRGYFDGDGSIKFAGKELTFSIAFLGTKLMLDYFKEFIESNDVASIKKYYYKKNETSKVGALEFGGNKQVYKFLNLIYGDSTIYLDRKYERYLLLHEKYSRAK